VLYTRQGEYDAADLQFARAHHLFTRVRNGPRRLAALYNQANLAREKGDAGESLGLYEAAARLADELKLRHVRAAAIAGVGLTALSLGIQEQSDGSRARLHALLADLGDRRFPGTEIVESFLLNAALSRGEPAAPAVQRVLRAIQELSTRDDYAYVWLVAECAPLLLEHGWEAGRELAARALLTAKSLQATPLIRRLTSLVDVDAAPPDAVKRPIR
jgi:hypothetical protein